MENENEKPRAVDGLELERIYRSITEGGAPPQIILYDGRVWTLNADGSYDSRPITDADCGE
jgi:hypothetical protein